MPQARDISDSLRPITPDQFGHREARHLLARAGFGGTPDQVSTLVEWGPEKSVDHLLDDRAALRAFDPPEAESDLQPIFTENEQRQFQRARRMQDEDTIARFRRIRQQKLAADRQQTHELETWWLRHMIETPYPLIEKMTLFWHGHFASSNRKVRDSWHMLQQNTLFRRNALGSFEELLRGIIRDPAMLRYLDNDRNVAQSPNENLARELMELFALGSGYTENDIKEGARALTGYTYVDDEFRFRQGRHDRGVKRIFGQRGPFDGDDFVRLILTRRTCPRFIAVKLYAFFVNEIPAPRAPGGRESRRVIARLARTMVRERYQIKPVLRELFLSEHFFDSFNRARLIKSPIELLVATVRTLAAPLRNEGALLRSAERMGQRLFHPPSVQGWVGGRSWINTATIFERQNAATYLITGATTNNPKRTQPMETDHLLSGLRVLGEDAMKDPKRVSDHLAEITLGGAREDRHRDALIEYFRAKDNRVDRETVAGALAILAAAPAYQLA